MCALMGFEHWSQNCISNMLATGLHITCKHRCVFVDVYWLVNGPVQ